MNELFFKACAQFEFASPPTLQGPFRRCAWGLELPAREPGPCQKTLVRVKHQPQLHVSPFGLFPPSILLILQDLYWGPVLED